MFKSIVNFFRARKENKVLRDSGYQARVMRIRNVARYRKLCMNELAVATSPVAKATWRAAVVRIENELVALGVDPNMFV